jgi:hypothetical protein
MKSRLQSAVMLTSSFIFLSGVGPTTERRWWDECLLDWDRFLNQSSIPGLSTGRKHWYDGELRTVRDLLDKGHFHLVATQLPRREHWRLYETCRSRFHAVRLWREWHRSDVMACETLLTYNRADTENLVLLADRLYEDMISRFGPPFLSSPLRSAYSR